MIVIYIFTGSTSRRSTHYISNVVTVVVSMIVVYIYWLCKQEKYSLYFKCSNSSSINGRSISVLLVLSSMRSTHYSSNVAAIVIPLVVVNMY